MAPGQKHSYVCDNLFSKVESANNAPIINTRLSQIDRGKIHLES
jgi:hypothetical protein